MSEALGVVWLKRDLRVQDHAALSRAAEQGRVIVLFVYEPEWLGSAEFDPQHLEFVNESLSEVRASLRELGGDLLIRQGELTAVLDSLWRETGFSHLWSHQETGSGWTYARDVRVAGWCRERGLPWTELAQNGVVRRLGNRDGWSARWESWAQQPVLPVPQHLKGGPRLSGPGLLGPKDFGLAPSGKERQRGGEREAWRTLETFLAYRGKHYLSEMSSPLTGAESCSRVSPYLTWGCLTVRQVEQRSAQALGELVERRSLGQDVERSWFASLKSFRSRLRWHCHFMQKLEDEPSLEVENLHRGYNGLRDEMTRSEEGRRRLEAWCRGQTGYPMVDACMRSCLATGWLNFRMRAMLASFAAYHLWLHWQQPAQYLAQHFSQVRDQVRSMLRPVGRGVMGPVGVCRMAV